MQRGYSHGFDHAVTALHFAGGVTVSSFIALRTFSIDAAIHLAHRRLRYRGDDATGEVEGIM